MTKFLLSPEAETVQYLYGWPDITPTQHTDPIVYNLNAAAESFYDAADAITDKALDRGDWEEGELEESAALYNEAETLEAIARGTIEFVIVEKKETIKPFMHPRLLEHAIGCTFFYRGNCSCGWIKGRE